MIDYDYLQNRFIIPSEEDPRDYNITQFIPGIDEFLGKEFVLKLPKQEIIVHQGATGSCVAHTLATSFAICQLQSANKWIPRSAFFLYGNRRSTDHQGPGMMPRQALKNMHSDGMWEHPWFTSEKEVPALYSDVNAAKQKYPQYVRTALDHCIAGYARLRTVEEIKIALKNGMPVAACWFLYDSFRSVGANGKVPVPTNAEKQLGDHGNHMMTIIGWTHDNHWVVVNSWGINVAHKGVYYMPFKYLPIETWSIAYSITPAKWAKKIVLQIGNRTMWIDDIPILNDVAPFTESNRTYIPIRVVSEALGASVEWVEADEQIIIRRKTVTLKLKINSTVMWIGSETNRLHMDVAPILRNGRTFLPIRFIAEQFDCKVDWNEVEQKVIITAT